ncbi:glycosyltransferase family 2 protein [Microbacterium xanthum]|uniref:glycosyltransferase family 2 protein n=1 Tax=Microbacterium xanthum TaxID=3079794 RepID=UPI002AD36442|nr:glycosyltransferase family 2 protein [Microbacterium sp. KSW-48]MDZ8172113.1 glycosyltransferase family 2 protein [Microbacterium sp. KSW-48]
MRTSITMIVPGWNVGPYAPAALASLRAQTRTDWNAVLIDDASDDDTAEIFDAAAAADERFRVVRHGARRGLGAARNTGLTLVGTPFLGFLDADDELTPSALAVLVGALEETGSDFVAGAYTRLRPDANGGYREGEVQPWVKAATAPARRATTLGDHPSAGGNIVAWSKASRTSFWRRAGLAFPEDRLYEDQVIAQQMYTRARRFDTVADVVVRWRVRPDGSSITQQEERLEVLRDCLDAMEGGLDVLRTAGFPAAVQERVHLILTMDLPRLTAIAHSHPDPTYRRLLGAFTRRVWSHAEAARARLDPTQRSRVDAVTLW